MIAESMRCQAFHLSFRSLFGAAAIVAIVSSDSYAEDWPAWRGPRGDGISREAHAPMRWFANESIAWKQAIPGVGRFSPIVSKGCVFLTTSEPSDPSRRVICLDAESGNLKSSAFGLLIGVTAACELAGHASNRIVASEGATFMGNRHFGRNAQS